MPGLLNELAVQINRNHEMSQRDAAYTWLLHARGLAPAGLRNNPSGGRIRAPSFISSSFRHPLSEQKLTFTPQPQEMLLSRDSHVTKEVTETQRG